MQQGGHNSCAKDRAHLREGVGAHVPSLGGAYFHPGPVEKWTMKNGEQATPYSPQHHQNCKQFQLSPNRDYSLHLCCVALSSSSVSLYRSAGLGVAARDQLISTQGNKSQSRAVQVPTWEHVGTISVLHRSHWVALLRCVKMCKVLQPMTSPSTTTKYKQQERCKITTPMPKVLLLIP